jgi:hypothetical protein
MGARGEVAQARAGGGERHSGACRRRRRGARRALTLLLDYLNEPERGSPIGWRVDVEGRVEQLSDSRAHVDDSGRVVLEPAPLEWREEYRLDANGLESLREAIRAALTRVDRDHYGQAGDVSDGRRLTWRFEIDGRRREIVVDGFPVVMVAPLDELLQTLLRARSGDEAVSTVWTWRTGTAATTREFAGEPAGVAKLAPLLELALPGALGEPAGDAPDDPPLLEIEWRVGGAPGDRLAVYPDGSRILEENGRARKAPPLGEKTLTTLIEGLASL